MAAKNKQRKRSKATRKGEFVTQDFEPEAESGGEREEEAPGRGGEAPGPGGGGEAGGGEEDQLSLDEVLHLGGTRADFVLLAGLDDSNELVDGGKKGAIDDLEAGELESFICKLGIRAYAGQQALADDAVTTATDDQKAIGGKTSGERPATKPTKKMAAAAAVTMATESQKDIKKGGEASGERPATKLTKKMAAAAVTAATKGGESSGERPATKPTKKTHGVVTTATEGQKAIGGGEASGERPATKLTKKMAAAAVTAATEDQKADGEAPGEGFAPKPAKKTRPGPDVFEFRRRQTLLVKPGGKWFAAGCTAEAAAAPQDAALVARYAALAERLLAAEVQLYKTTRKGANAAWMKTVVTAGVLADRMAAMTVLVQDAPVHSLEHVEALVALMRRRGGRRAGLMALETLRELLLSDLLPEGRKLRPLELRPFDLLENRASGNRDARDRRLVLWMFEHRLKEQVASFVAALGSVASDPVAAARSLSLSAAQQLLVSRPEQERALLALIANKLGAPEPRTAARAAHLLGALLRRHAAMAPAVCAEVERLVLRPGAGPRAQYRAVTFLSQVALCRAQAPLAARLVALYFCVFRAAVRQKEARTRMLSALLAGVNRAYPYAGAGDPRVREQMGTLFRVAQTADFNTAMQALMLLFQVMDAEQSVSDRYYCSLYRKLLDPGLASSSRQNLFLNLLYKSLKADVAPRRVQAFVRRLLQVCALLGASFACGALFLVSEVLRARPGLRGLLTEDGEEEEEDFRDQEEEEKEEEEKEEEQEKEEEEGGPAPPPAPKASWVHHQNLEGGGSSRSYDPLHRNPLYCGAHRSAFWELQRLALHYHPSVSLFARTLLKGESIQYSGDPLQDFTLIRFLDRFVFRNPKQPRNRGDSAAQRSNQKFSVQLPVNSAEFLSRDESQVPVDQVFFHRYFRKRQQQQQSRRPRRDGDEESLEDVDDEEFERLLDSCEGDSLYADLGDEQLDFAGNVTGKKRRKGEEDSDSEAEDLDDEEVSLGSMDEEDFGDELEEEGGTFMDPDGDDEEEEEDVPELEEEDEEEEEEEDAAEEDWEEEAPAPPPRKRKSPPEPLASAGPKRGKISRREKKNPAMSASAEEFGSLLDENADSRLDSGGLNAMATGDRAGLKQLRWEVQRDEWIHDRDAKTLRRRKAAGRRGGAGGGGPGDDGGGQEAPGGGQEGGGPGGQEEVVVPSPVRRPRPPGRPHGSPGPPPTR